MVYNSLIAILNGDWNMIGIFIALINTEEEKTKFVDLYEKYRKLMFFIANDILKDSNLAEDAVQEAFIRIAKNFKKIGDVSCPRTKAFVVIITRNVAITMISKEAKAEKLQEKVSQDLVKNTDEVFDSVSYKVLVEAILDLPQKYRDVLYLNHVYGYNYNEVSNLLSISVDAVKKRARRGRAKLKEFIEMESTENHGQ